MKLPALLQSIVPLALLVSTGACDPSKADEAAPASPDAADPDAAPKVAVANNLPPGGATLFVETLPGAAVTATIKTDRDDVHEPFTVTATADEAGHARIEVVPEEVLTFEKFTAEVAFEADGKTGQANSASFTPEEDAVAIEFVKPPGDQKASFCQGSIRKPSTFFRELKVHAKGDAYELRVVGSTAKSLEIDGKTHAFSDTTHPVRLLNADYTSKELELPTRGVTVSVPKEVFRRQLTAQALASGSAHPSVPYSVTLEDGTKLEGQIDCWASTDFDLDAFLESPKPTEIAGDDKVGDRETALLVFMRNDGKRDAVVFGEGAFPMAAVRHFVVATEAPGRELGKCNYRNVSTGERVKVGRRAHDRKVRIYDRKTGKLTAQTVIKASKPQCTEETYGDGAFVSRVGDNEVESWAAKKLVLPS